MQIQEFRGTSVSPHLLITGGVHGDEYEPILALIRLGMMLNACDAATLQGRVTLIPIVNQSAYCRAARTGDDGLDLARSCPGAVDGSVTQRTAWELTGYIRTADYYIDLHTGGTEFSVFPLSGYMMHPNPAVLEQQRRMARAFNLPLVWGTSAHLEGRSLSVARDAEIPAIYCEYLGGETCSAAGVSDYVDGCMNVMCDLGILSHPRRQSREKYIVEDATPESGHMQVCHPSPADGTFIATAELGEIVTCGTPIGHVIPNDGGHLIEIPADKTGLLIVRRASQEVLAGSSTGVVVAVH